VLDYKCVRATVASLHPQLKPCESVACIEACGNGVGIVWTKGIGGLQRGANTTQCMEPWTVVDAAYFCVATVSTVGYGDFYPRHLSTKIFTFFYMIAGIPFIFLLLCSLTQSVAYSMLAALRHSLRRTYREGSRLARPAKQLAASPAGAAEHAAGAPGRALSGLSTSRSTSRGSSISTYTKAGPRMRAANRRARFISADDATFGQFLRRDFIPLAGLSYLAFCGANMLFALAFVQLQPAWGDYFDREYGQQNGPILAYFAAVFHTAVTATTVGYTSGPLEAPGFVEPGAQAARALATVHILFAVTALSIFFEQWQRVLKKHRAREREAAMLHRECDPDLLATLDQGGGVAKHEYDAICHPDSLERQTHAHSIPCCCSPDPPSSTLARR